MRNNDIPKEVEASAFDVDIDIKLFNDDYDNVYDGSEDETEKRTDIQFE